MNPEIVNAGIYVSHLPAWMNRLSAYSDFAWFVALTAWALAWLLWRNRARQGSDADGWRWLPWSLASGVAITAIHLAHMIFSRVAASPNGPFLPGDLAMGAITALTPVGWWWEALAGSRHRRSLCGALLVLVIACAAWRYDFFAAEYPTALLAALALLSALPLLTKRSVGPAARVAVVLAALLPLSSTVGPVAYAYSMMERYTVLSPAALWAGAAQAVAAVTTLVALARHALAAEPDRRATWQEARPFLVGAVAWGLAMLLLAALVGERQRRRTEERAREQVRLAATLFDPAVLAPFQDPRWRLDNIPPARVRNNPIRRGWSDYLATDAAGPAVRAFATVAQAARNAVYVRFVTINTGWLVAPINQRTPREGSFRRLTFSVGPKDGRVLLLRETTADDLRQWSEKAEVIEGLTVGRMMGNGHVFVRAPLSHRDGQMAGWLEFTYTADDFLSETVQARVAPLTGLLLGSLVATFMFIQRREARARAAADRTALIAAETSRTKTDFLAKVSHELRTPLQSLLGYGELIGRDPLSAAAREHLLAQQQHGELMLRLVNDLLDLSAMEAGVFRLNLGPTNASAAVTDAVAGFRAAAAAKGLVLHCSIQPEVPAWILTDAQRLRQCVINLVGNAVKFTERGGVAVSLSVLARHATDYRLELAVRDTGPGISAADQARLFQPFIRLAGATAHEGSGLGLALTRALCRSLGGDLAVESDGRSGACFRATWPAAIASAPVDAAPINEKPATLRGRRILLADDNALVRELFATWLRDLGAACEIVCDGEEALARARAGGFDAVVLDFSMPRMDGAEVARSLRAAGQRCRIVGVSAHADANLAQRARAAGMDAFLTKPVKLADLAAALSHDTVPGPDEKDARLHAELVRLFQAGAAAQIADVTQALASRDWTRVSTCAHRLKNSAGVLGDVSLLAVCAEIEAAAESRNWPAAEAAWGRAQSLLARWM